MEAKFNQTSSVFLFWASISPNFILTKGHAFTVLARGTISSHLGLKGRSQPLSLLDPHGIPPKTLLPCVSSIQQSPHFPTTTILVQICPPSPVLLASRLVLPNWLLFISPKASLRSHVAKNPFA